MMKAGSKILIIYLFVIGLSSCEKNNLPDNVDFRQEMRNFVMSISDYARSKVPGFIVIPQNGRN
ncbi:hypothetical protein ACE01N_13385 [Saccharicrinis sp. FJH2]|uniref:hypothetical protein n=1 Tax=Saccharicrinis sp. FJH65 TaxID=3344659 RepID=UPI0035F22D7B